MAGIQDQGQWQHWRGIRAEEKGRDHHHEDHSIWHKEGA